MNATIFVAFAPRVLLLPTLMGRFGFRVDVGNEEMAEAITGSVPGGLETSPPWYGNADLLQVWGGERVATTEVGFRDPAVVIMRRREPSASGRIEEEFAEGVPPNGRSLYRRSQRIRDAQWRTAFRASGDGLPTTLNLTDP